MPYLNRINRHVNVAKIRKIVLRRLVYGSLSMNIARHCCMEVTSLSGRITAGDHATLRDIYATSCMKLRIREKGSMRRWI